VTRQDLSSCQTRLVHSCFKEEVHSSI
jgi:hypothetical protein